MSTLIIVISLGCLILAVVFLLTLSALLDGFTLYHTTAYLHIITMINMNCALWYINCRAIGNASTALAESFQNVCQIDLINLFLTDNLRTSSTTAVLTSWPTTESSGCP